MADILMLVSGRHYVENEVFQVENHYLSFGAAVLEKHNYDVKVYDFNLNPQEYNIQDLINEKPKLIIVFTHLNSYDWEPNKKLIELISKEEAFKETHLSLWIQSPNHFHEYLIDGIVDSLYLGNIGEEQSIVRYVSSVLENCVKDSPATVFLQNGSIKINKPLPLSSQEELNELPYYKRYQFENLKKEKKPFNNLLCLIRSSYGCYGKCTFCQVQSFADFYERYNWRIMSPGRVVDEIENVNKEYGVKFFYFGDPLFIGPGKKGKKYAKEIAREIMRRNIDVKFFLYARADTVDDETIKILKEAGLTTILLGLESFSQTQLNRYTKGTKVKTNMRAIDICKKYDIYIHPGFILFDAETTIEELEENIVNLKEICKTKGWLFSKPEKLIGGVLFVTEGTPSHLEYTKKGFLYNQSAEHIENVDKHALKRNHSEAFIYQNSKLATIAHACGLVRGEIGRQILINQKYRTSCLKRISENPNHQQSHEELKKLIEWNKYLAKFTVETLSYIVEQLKDEEEHEIKQFEVLDSVWESFMKYNTYFLGKEKALIHSLEKYQEIKREYVTN
ncbi:MULTISPECIES: B12-binding domain-containing radical SAM protein [Bacillus]|uniref:Radical SAM superfamily enzyme YgiQ (UPF0313 family) n=1 Tax=Bacillus mycoides TaxID=1405 RepID=A0A3D9VB89_BACMY|nr:MULTISPECIES: radical SAM protein [Bacillus]RBP24967.1 radical SAM superfamily enzyme YgiQ (UPF0313 family) [Bacillus sp. DB-2]REF38546.1 radical SAM superfamily enzyme YgiQ (UPF0313 family) [Bacillus mycoides]